MRFAPRRPRRPNENIVPLINVVFLLLVFFMLTGTLRPQPPLDVELPREPSGAAAVAPEPEGRSLTLSATGELALDDVRLGRVALEDALDASPARTLRLRADARTPARILLPVLETLEAHGVEQVDVVTDLGP